MRCVHNVNAFQFPRDAIVEFESKSGTTHKNDNNKWRKKCYNFVWLFVIQFGRLIHTKTIFTNFPLTLATENELMMSLEHYIADFIELTRNFEQFISRAFA